MIDLSILQLDVYSATLYDALLTYAMAAKKIKDEYYSENGSQELAVREANVKALIKNGTRMAKVCYFYVTFWNLSRNSNVYKHDNVFKQ